MNLDTIKTNLQNSEIFLSEENVLNNPSVVGYEKKFKWKWMATQLNTFFVATDFGDAPITKEVIEQHLTESYAFAKKNYKGWPKGLQSGVGVISVLMSSNIDDESKEYCRKLKSGKKWAGFTIPVTVDSSSNEVSSFQKNPMWGRIYYPHFRKLIENNL